MAEALRLGQANLIRTIEQALAKIDDDVTADFDSLNAKWQAKYDALKAESEKTRSSLEAKIETLVDQVSELQAELEQSKAERLAEQDKSTEENGGNGSGGTSTESVAELRQSLEKAHVRYAALKGHLDTVVNVARTRKEQVVGWVKYADSLELKIQKLERKRSRHPAAGGSVLPLADPAASSSGTRGATPHIPLTPVTLEKPRLLQAHTTDVEKPTLSASFSSSSSSFLGIPAASDSDDDDNDDDGGIAPRDDTTSGSEDKDYELPRLPARTSTTADDDRQSNEAAEATIESTQGEPSSDGALPDFPTPRASAALSTTTGEGEKQVCVKEEPSSDSPEVVWERPAKRSRTDEQSRTPLAPPPTKRERDTSGTATLSSVAHYRESQESVDLDEGQLTMPTPRKRQLFLDRTASELVESDQSPSESQSQQSSLQQGFNPPPQVSTAQQCPPPAPGPQVQTPRPSAALAPVSANIRRGGAKEPVTIMKSLKREIESLAGDGEGYRTPDGSTKRTGTKAPASAASCLNSMLNVRPVEPSPVIAASGRRSPLGHQNQRAFEGPLPRTFGLPPPPRILPLMRGTNNNTSPKVRSAALAGAAAATTTTTTPASGRLGANVHTPAGSTSRPREPRESAAAAAATPTTTVSSLTALIEARAESAARKPAARLRGKPMDQLKMDDFKINPASNHGDAFAYSEVVRGRTDRANLAGCTDPQCCGKVFRGMAVSELDAAGPAHVGRPAGVTLMERHLGGEAFKLSTMGPGEKRELWIEARTKELADKYGKHRHRYHRRASPPGFWDTDFPTTQEEEYNRAEAEKVERITVQERYREAMKPGGRWLFRDE